MSLLRGFLVGLLLASLAARCEALPYSELIVFGDSLSDVGNVKQSSLGLFPGSAYFNGRFSNGPVYSELLADMLGVGVLDNSRSGGSNFAHGNAKAAGNASGFVLDVPNQVTQFLQGGGTDPNALYVVFAGANDFFDGQTDVNVPVGSLVSDINRLIDDGVENLLVANLPLLGLTPEYNGDPVLAASFNTITESFNSTLWTALDVIEAAEPTIDLFRLDVAQLINDAVADPAAFGFANVTDSAAPGLTGTTLFYNTNLIVDQPNTYLFWDNVHPTAAAHALLAEFAFDAVTFSADFDFDGDVDNLDLAQWQASYGVDVQADANEDGLTDGSDFLVWQRQFGSGVVSSPGPLVLVPEPGAVTIAVSFCFSCVIGLRRGLGTQQYAH